MEGQCREKFRGAGRPSVSLTSPLREGTEWLKHTRGTEARDRVAQRAVDRVSSIHTLPSLAVLCMSKQILALGTFLTAVVPVMSFQ